ncbi:MAG TPA: Clp protease N-terminal domain-containing protein, partial [Mycobacteriales bacterium]|nr:Clp protease N-terminal domain-containing protein [Mycobacteriales bacterium]
MEANKLTTRSQEAISAAVRLSADRGHPTVEPTHLLTALLGQADGTALPLLRAVGADVADVKAENDALLGRLPSATGATVSAPQFGRDLHRAISAAAKQAEALNDEYLSTEHLLVGLASDGGPVAGLLSRHG